jgi:predicted negative regulator of RcsB-dependent stress response
MSSNKLTKDDLRQPDALAAELKKGFEWTTHHVRIVLGLGVAFVVLGLAWVGYSTLSKNKETAAQESYYKAEKAFIKQRETLNKSADAAKATDFEKDFGTQTPALARILKDFPGSAASRMAALLLASEQMHYNRMDLAQATLTQVQTSSDLLSAMVLLQKGKVQASQKDCPAAQISWAQALAIKGSGVMAPDVHLQQGLCFETTGDKVKAEESYNKVLAEAKDSPFAHSADQYLRLLHQL